MKRFLTILCVIALVCGMLPLCVSAAGNTRTLTFGQMHGYFRSLGRTVEHADSLYMDNVASGFELYFYGSGDVVVNASVLCNTPGEIAQYLSVYVDNQLTRVRVACNARGVEYDKSITLASGLSQGYHHIAVYRQTEAQTSLFRAVSLTFNGELLATAPEKPLTIDVIGDSISGGYGCLWNSSLGVSDPNDNHPKYQDGTQTYAFYAGKALGADVRVTQSSGYGCVAGWNGRGVNLQTMYPLTCWFRSNTFAHTFDPLADIVIINLGTNDYNTRQTNGISNAEFQAGAKNLMQMAKTYNPDATVVWCTGLMGTFYETEVKAAIAELGGVNAGYHFVKLPQGQGGAVTHPTAAQQAAAGDVLLSYLKANVLPQDYAAATATEAQLRAVIREAAAVTTPSAALSGAITRAQAELAVGTTDTYRLYARLSALQDAMAGDITTVNLLPKEHVSQTPTAADGVSYIWPYYGNSDSSVTLYKGHEGFYWPQIRTTLYDTVDIDETPYLVLDFASDAQFNMTITYLTAGGETAYVRASELADMGTNDLPAQKRGKMTLDFGAYIRKMGHADNQGLVSLIGCDMFVIGEASQYVRVYEATFTSKNKTPDTITGDYPVANGVVYNVPLNTTADALIAAMDHGDLLTVRDANGNVVNSKLATGMTLEMAQNGTVITTATIAVDGDLNGDGNASSLDARVLLVELLEADTLLSDAQSAAADLTDDGELSTADARLILKATF